MLPQPMSPHLCTPSLIPSAAIRGSRCSVRIEDEEASHSTPVERRLVAILAADIEGYSRLMHENEEATLATLLSHRQMIEGLVATAHGRITGTAGDSVLAEFASILDAVHCGVAIQLALSNANAALLPARRMSLRMGINV